MRSYSAYANTIVGVKIDPKDKFFTTRTVKVGDHDHPPDIRFDAKTGAPLWREETFPLFDTDDPECGIIDIRENPIGDIEAHWPMCRSDSSWLIVGVRVGEDSQYRPFQTPWQPDPRAMQQYYKALQALLMPHGLWDPSRFGVWTLLRESY